MTHGIIVFDNIEEYKEWTKTHEIVKDVLVEKLLDDGQYLVVLKGE